MYDIDTIQTFRTFIRKQLTEIKDHLIYSVDTIEELNYARGKINALETLLQDLTDLQKKENNIYDIEQKT
jgi:hypothetical protein|tara:strand:+ start:856 stop:1065 length:210 start_codon:yes stop_codon:yes gene_type:complete